MFARYSSCLGGWRPVCAVMVAFSAFISVHAPSASAAEHVIKMVNKAGNKLNQFDPAFVSAAPGDTIKVEATQKAHNVESMPEIWPEGATPIKGGIGHDVSFTVDKEGVYGLKCVPHYAMGMVALVQVGNPVNLDQVKNFKGPAVVTKRLQELAAEVK